MELTLEAKLDLRKRVLAGERLTLEQSRAIVENLCAGRRATAEAVAAAKPSSKSKKRKMTDDELDDDLDSAIATVLGTGKPDGDTA